MTKTELLALADRIEAAPEGSRELDAAIAKAVDPSIIEVSSTKPGECWRRGNRDARDYWSFECATFTTGPEMDLSAAWSLVPEGWSVDILDFHFYPRSQNWRVKAKKRKHSVQGTHARLNCALCTAALRARAAEMGDEG